MIPGLTPVGAYAVAVLPAAYDLSEPDPLAAILRDSSIPRTYLLEAAPWDRDALALAAQDGLEGVRFSSDGYATEPDDPTLPGVLFPARLAVPLNISVAIMTEGRLQPAGIPSFGSSDLVNVDEEGTDGLIFGELDHLVGYSWGRREMSVKVGTSGFQYAEFGPIFTGVCEDLTYDHELLHLRLRGYEFLLAKPIQSRLYRGMGAEGRYDGTNDHSAHTSLTATHSTVFQCWFHCDGDNATVTAQVMASHASAWTTSGIDWYLEVSTAGLLRALITRGAGGGTTALSYAGVDVRDGVRRHLALRLASGTNQCVLYIDGAVVAMGTEPGFSAITGNLEIGRRNGNADSYFKGGIDEVKFYKVDQSASQILDDMNREVQSPTAADFHGYWKFNEQAGTSLGDSSGNARTGAATGMTWGSSLEGGEDLAGKPKPLAFGKVRQIKGVLIDSLNLIYQLHDGELESVDEADDEGVALTPAGDVSDLYATSVSAGQFKTDLARGLVRLGTKPIGEATFTAQGDALGGYVSTAADIARRIVSRHGGLVDARIDLGAIARLNTANSAVCGYATTTEAENMDAILSSVLGSVGAWWTYTRAGIFRVQRLEPPENGVPVGVLDETRVLYGGIARGPCAPPSKRQRLTYQRVWQPQQSSSLATSLTEEQRRYLGEEWRYVTGEAGSARIETADLDAEDVDAETYLDDRAAAQAEADRRQALFGVRRNAFTVPLAEGLFQYNLGEIWTLQIRRFGLAAGRPCVIVGITEDVASDSTILELWG